jgi:hypothetical protein
MIDVDCDQTPLTVGETRMLRVTGDAPFAVSISPFVSDRRSMPFQSGLDTVSKSIEDGEPMEITADEGFWSSHQGGLQIDIADAVGSRRRLHINVRPKSKGLGPVMGRP